MREIKFRVWDESIEEIVTCGDDRVWGVITNHYLLRTYPDDCIMQYTGLKDCNGQEIYEGDILQFIDEKMKVFFNKYTACFDVEFIAGGCGECEPLVNGEWDEEDVEVIGNVYQNPELLEAEGVEE